MKRITLLLVLVALLSSPGAALAKAKAASQQQSVTVAGQPLSVQVVNQPAVKVSGGQVTITNKYAQPVPVYAVSDRKLVFFSGESSDRDKCYTVPKGKALYVTDFTVQFTAGDPCLVYLQDCVRNYVEKQLGINTAKAALTETSAISFQTGWKVLPGHDLVVCVSTPRAADGYSNLAEWTVSGYLMYDDTPLPDVPSASDEHGVWEVEIIRPTPPK
ncbi:MAG: hypothetical protein V2A77_05930 [Pseudomonadota bacterium]